jgi:glycine/D-amino acid oxidase-like deaminating enzyme
MAAAFARAIGVVCAHTRHVDVAAGTVVYATGGERTPHLVKGHLIATEPAPFLLGEIVATIDSGFLALQLPSGRIVAGGTKEPGDGRPDVRDGTVERIRSTLVEIAPEADGLGVTHAWTCFRPKMDDELPLIDRIDDRTIVATGFYSTGILMAPVAGEIVAAALADGTELPAAFTRR